MKHKMAVLICALFMTLSVPMLCTNVSAEPDVLTDAEMSEIEQETEESTSKGVKIAGFLIIFTIAMGTTAVIVARPKFKKLKEIKKHNQK